MSSMPPFFFFVSRTLKVLCKILFRFEHHGAENVPQTGGVILASNHASHLDPVVIACSLHRSCNAMAKEALFKVPVFSWVIRKLGAYPVRPSGVDRTSIRQCVEAAKSGNALIIFPEGQRTDNGELQPARAGVGMIAAMAGVPVVPIYVQGSYDALPRGSHWPRLAKIHVYFGKPILPPTEGSGDGRRPRDRNDAFTDQIMAEIARLGGVKLLRN
ncbi:MAG: 1-acyl-sn-glycerol-3-phosphate acyltransferase [Candidatus Sumerlaeaceae bacterium]|nr:1-acyl-sn-glycerol-3-phosphate acyltransferase [Candidatus Sumerlaeaceae bacterium]